MMRSMTGFARETGEYEWGTLSVELSSVNHRYQELSVRLSRELASFEPEAGAILRSALGRGKVRLFAEIAWAPGYKTPVIDGEALKSYYDRLLDLGRELGAEEKPDIQALLSLPGVLDSPSARSSIGDELGEALAETVKRAASSLTGMREREGEALKQAVEGYLADFESLLGSMEEYWNKRKDELLEELKARVTALLEGVTGEADEARVAQEIVIMADKWDVSEEAVRSRSHCAQFKSILNGPASEGRKLDFLIQEMNREVNTMGSKITDAELRWMVVEAKSTLEKMREQIQNAE